MKTVIVVMCKENDGLPTDKWISAIFEDIEKACEYISQCHTEDQDAELKWWTEEWQVK
jgi:hypothetical protein